MMNELRLRSGDYSDLGILYDEVEANTRSLADVQIDFQLFRDGELRVWTPTFTDEDLARNSEAYAASRGVSFVKWAADQAYFFLRDLCHAHQHHSPSVDTILILQDWLGYGDVTWRNNILYSLNHYIIRLRRSLHSEDLHRANGVSAYARSFLALSDRREPSKPTAPFNIEATEMS